VYFIGAGPGAPDLLTLRGKTVLEAATLVVYADSLVDPRVCDFARPDARVIGSSGLTLDEITACMVDAAREGQTVARLQSGDPSVYGAIREQIARLDAAQIRWRIIPGVSSFSAAAAALGAELTVPDIAQTVILTRISGRASPVPEREALEQLAAHQTTLVLFLSIGHLTRVVTALRDGGYPAETPVAVVYRVSWPDQQVIRGTLLTIRDQVREEHLTRQALILVGSALDAGALKSQRSQLYSERYTHLFRTAKVPDPQHDGATRD
jgi:precorrin-4 C11-methyltransferase